MAKSRARSFWLGTLFVVAVAGALAGAVYIGIQIIRPAPVDYFRSAPPVSSSDQSVAPSPEDVRIPVAAMGDMIADDAVLANAQTASGGEDFAQFFSRIRSTYADAELVFCNQEGPSGATAGTARGFPDYNAPAAFSAGLSSGAGCNAVGLASNRMAASGQAAIDATLEQWDALDPLLVSGANRSSVEQQSTRIATVDGVRIALVSFTQFSANTDIDSYAVNLYNDDELFTSLVTEAREQADFVIVSMHWGRDDSAEVTTDQNNYAQRLADLGADVVIGTGPHTLQRAQWYAGADGHRTLVWFSLGNMLSGATTMEGLVGGVAHWDFLKTVDGELSIENVSLTPTYLAYGWSAESRLADDTDAISSLTVYPLSEAGDVLAQTWPDRVVEGEFSLARVRVGTEFVPFPDGWAGSSVSPSPNG